MHQHSRRIIVMRHSKAEPAGASDLDRELTAEGRSRAAAAGSWLAGQDVVPDHALVSAATRARQTWEAVASAAGWDIRPELDRGLHAAGPETALDLLRGTPDAASTLMFVGHNPTVAYLAAMLDDGEGDPDAIASMAAGYPTSALTVLSYDGAWVDLAAGTARVEAFHVERG